MRHRNTNRLQTVRLFINNKQIGRVGRDNCLSSNSGKMYLSPENVLEKSGKFVCEKGYEP